MRLSHLGERSELRSLPNVHVPLFHARACAFGKKFTRLSMNDVPFSRSSPAPSHETHVVIMPVLPFPFFPPSAVPRVSAGVDDR